MKFSQLCETQALDLIEWSEPEAGTLAYRYPMLDLEIQTGAKLAVRDGEMAVFVEQGRMADVFGPGMYGLSALTLPLLSNLKGWEKGFASPFKSDIYFFSTVPGIDQKWGTSTPVALRDEALEPTSVRSYGSYSYRIADPHTFFMQVSGTRESYFVYDLDDALRRLIVARMADSLVASGLSHPEQARSKVALRDKLVEQLEPAFAALGLELTQFAIEAVSMQGASDGLTGCGCCGASMRLDHGILKCDYCHAVVAADAGVHGESEGTAVRLCPSCAIPLLHAMIGTASLLYCTRCDGMLVATEEFDRLIAASRAVVGGSVPVQGMHPGGVHHSIACPHCRRAMAEQLYGWHVAIGCCRSCGLNWLGHEELARIAHGAESEFGAEADGSGAYFNAARADFNISA